MEEQSILDDSRTISSLVDELKLVRQKAGDCRKRKLWGFFLNLLLEKKYNPSVIKWENREKGVFRIVLPDQIAKLWGERKGNSSMTFEKISRAMRYYCKKAILHRIEGRKLVFMFGDQASGWQLSLSMKSKL